MSKNLFVYRSLENRSSRQVRLTQRALKEAFDYNPVLKPHVTLLQIAQDVEMSKSQQRQIIRPIPQSANEHVRAPINSVEIKRTRKAPFVLVANLIQDDCPELVSETRLYYDRAAKSMGRRLTIYPIHVTIGRFLNQTDAVNARAMSIDLLPEDVGLQPVQFMPPLFENLVKLNLSEEIMVG